MRPGSLGCGRAAWIAGLLLAGAHILQSAQAQGLARPELPNDFLPPSGSAAAPGGRLQVGVVEQIDLAKAEFTVSGQRLKWDAQRLVIRQAAASAPVSGLQAWQVLARISPGQKLRYQLEAGSGGSRRVVLMYLEPSP